MPDGTMAVHFRNWCWQVNQAVGETSLLSVWGAISGTLSAQTDLQTALNTANGSAAWGSITGTLSSQTDLNTALTTIPTSSITSGTFADARISQSSVTQHQAALSITESQISDLQAYLIAWEAPAFRDESSTTYTMVVGDANKVIRFTGTNPAVTIPTGTFAVGDVFYIRQAGTGTLVLTTTSLTINGTVPVWVQHTEVGFRYVATDTYDVI
jgi:hypothetical protein